MKRIDAETVRRIIDAADIVEVVSDFVTLKRRGANYMGLCPFHSERTPSFSVSKSKGICKCFSCGKGGSPVGFLMELEQMSYQEALRWLARKYGIEIVEREQSAEEMERESERESLFAVNEFAASHFEKNLHDTEAGRDIGLSYFKERGLSNQTMERFRLGYALERSDALVDDALRNGFTADNLVKTGLCSTSDRDGRLFDRFRGRVVFPVRSVSGKVVAFGGRTLRTDKNVAKYVNSPESVIYSKSRELYGLYEARRAIVKEDRCFLVEGYMDVLSMSQSGVENVVASSGTSLTSQQVNLIHRFTANVTVIYDADAAGIKASLRGIDMLLAEGMDVKVVLFPEGEDPDSYARNHTRTELADYIAANQTDFIGFKTEILLGDAGDDPVARSKAIADILRSIAVIPDAITRQIYVEESARRFGMNPRLLALEVAKGVARIAENAFVERERQTAAKTLERPIGTETTQSQTPAQVNRLERYEKALMRYLLRYGMLEFSEAYDEKGNVTPLTVLDYVVYELDSDGIGFTDPVCSALFERLRQLSAGWPERATELAGQQSAERERLRAEGLERIRNSAAGVAQIVQSEQELETGIEARLKEMESECRRDFFQKQLLSDPHTEVRRLVTELATDRHSLSKMHHRHGHVAAEHERLQDLVPRAVFELKDAILAMQIEDINRQLKECPADSTEVNELFARLIDKMKIRTEFARYLGDRIITPNIKI